MAESESYRILYVEDNPTDFEMVKAVLEDEGIISEIINARNREEYVESINTGGFDIILTDYSLPVFHGLEAIGIARELCPDLPIIMITGTLPDEIAVEVIKKGAWDYVLKENVYRLIPSIRSVMERKYIQTDRQRALDALKESEENYRVLAESSPYGIIVHSEGMILYYNKQAVKIFRGEESGSYLGVKLFDFVHPEYEVVVSDRIKRLYKGEIDNRITELKYLNAYSEELMLEVASSPIRFKGKPAAQVIFRDIAERKKMESDLIRAKDKAEESDRLKTAFLENLSHEIRTPLNGIIGFASLLKLNDLSYDDKSNYVNIIEESGKHLLSIIDDLIEVSRLDTGQVDLRISKFNMNHLLDEIFIFFNDGARFKDRSVILGISKALRDEEANFEADKARLRQIFYNLISNSYKFTTEGRIDYGYEITNNNSVLFFVKDTGIGIPECAKTIVFERFRQADDSTTRLYGGTGLGLTICKGLAEAMSGKIWFESRVDSGTEFFFELPLKGFSYKKPAQLSGVDRNNINWNMKSVLIAEDEPSNFILLKHILSGTGINITHVTNGQDVLKKINEGGIYDLLLLDIKMPDLNGLETVRHLRSNNFTSPVIAQTAYAMSDDRDKCIEAGFNEYITKPIKPEELLEKMQRFIGE